MTLESAEAVFAPVRSQTAFEETVDRLGTAIKLGLLPPGTQLPPERELCAMLGIARSTLRQALTTLVQSGDQVLTAFDAEMTTPLEAALAERGVELILGDTAAAFEEGPGGLVVLLRSGRRLEAGLVVLADAVLATAGRAGGE